MSAILLVWGILIIGAGVIALGYGIPISDSAVGQTLILAGAVGLIGGPVLVGFAVALARLRAIAAALATLNAKTLNATPSAETARVADVEPATDVKQTADAPPPAATAAIPTAAIVQLRTGMASPNQVVAIREDVPLSPNGGQQRAEPMPEPKPVARSGTVVEALNEPRLDFLFRSRVARSTRPESFDAAWQKRGTHEAPHQSGTDNAAQPPASAPPVEEAQAPPALVPAEVPRSATVLKSGVVDGMAYTLYADGSIEAQLAHGTVRFGSIAELRAHIENNS